MRATMQEARSRASHGAAFLDRHGPAEWHKAINLETLALFSTQHCVLGQLYGGFWTGDAHYKNNGCETGEYNAHALGFWDNHSTVEADYDRLTRAWRDLIRSRQVNEMKVDMGKRIFFD